MFRGYWKQPQATADAFIEHDGKQFFRTGDLGYYDEEGYFFITDRLKRMINASGFKVWPAEVEAMLYAHPDIQEACVIGTRDPHRGETVKAVVVLKAAARGRVQPDAIVAWAKDRMAAYKYPRVVEFVDALPKTATGKIFWRKLQEDESEEERGMRILAFALLLIATAADAQVEIEKAWARATAPGAPVAGGYMMIRNKAPTPTGSWAHRPLPRRGRAARARQGRRSDEDAPGLRLRRAGEWIVRAEARRRAPDVPADRATVQGRRQDSGEAEIRESRRGERRVRGRKARRQRAARAQALE